MTEDRLKEILEAGIHSMATVEEIAAAIVREFPNFDVQIYECPNCLFRVDSIHVDSSYVCAECEHNINCRVMSDEECTCGQPRPHGVSDV